MNFTRSQSRQGGNARARQINSENNRTMQAKREALAAQHGGFAQLVREEDDLLFCAGLGYIETTEEIFATKNGKIFTLDCRDITDTVVIYR